MSKAEQLTGFHDRSAKDHAPNGREIRAVFFFEMASRNFLLIANY